MAERDVKLQAYAKEVEHLAELDALNKVDKPEATDSNIQRILGQLADRSLNWGSKGLLSPPVRSRVEAFAILH